MTPWLVVFWPGLAGAALLGAGVGWACFPPRGWPVILGLLGVAGLLAGLSAAVVVPGPAGIWVETAAGMLWAYLGGCALGGLTRAGHRRSETGRDR